MKHQHDPLGPKAVILVATGDASVVRALQRGLANVEVVQLTAIDALTRTLLGRANLVLIDDEIEFAGDGAPAREHARRAGYSGDIVAISNGSRQAAAIRGTDRRCWIRSKRDLPRLLRQLDSLLGAD
jgi:hypothetical protein